MDALLDIARVVGSTLDLDTLLQAGPRGAVDEDRALRDLRVRLDARGQVHRLADARVSRAIDGPGVPGHHRARRDADADTDARLGRSVAFPAEQLD